MVILSLFPYLWTGSGCGAVRLAHFVRDEGAAGSNPVIPTVKQSHLWMAFFAWNPESNSFPFWVTSKTKPQACFTAFAHFPKTSFIPILGQIQYYTRLKSASIAEFDCF